MDFLVGSVRRHLNGSRTKSRSLPFYGKASEARGNGPNADPASPLHRRVGSSSPVLDRVATTQPEKRKSTFKRRNSSSCLPSPGQVSDSDDGSGSDTTSCSSLEFLPASSYQQATAAHEHVTREASGARRERLDAVKARVAARRSKYKDDSSSSSDEGHDPAPPEPGALPRFHSDEVLHRPVRNRTARRPKRRSEEFEAAARTQVTRSDPQLPSENRSPVTWLESSAYQTPHGGSSGAPATNASDVSPSSSIRRSPNPVLPPNGSLRGVVPARKPLTVNVHGSAGHFQPAASPCDSGLGSHSVTSSPSLGRAPTPPLRSPRTDALRHPPTLNPTSGPPQGQLSGEAWWRKKQGLFSQLTPDRTEVTSPRLLSRVYAYTDQAPSPSSYLSDSQSETVRNHAHEFSRKLGAWKAMESATRNADKSAASASKPRLASDVSALSPGQDGRQLMDVCRSRSVVWPKDFSAGVSRSPAFEGSPRSSPLVWSRRDASDGHSPTPTRSTVTSPAQGGESPTPKSSPVPPRLWSPTSPPVRTQSPDRTPPAVQSPAAGPTPPTRVGSLDAARRSVDNLMERERRRRCSEHLEDALQELETIYQSLKLNEDEELLDRAERRDLPEWRSAPGGRWQKRYSIADPTGTGGFPLARSYSDQASRLRRSAVPDKVTDDLAVRKWQQRPTAAAPVGRPPGTPPPSPSYLLCSAAYTPSLSVQPATRDVTRSREPDPELDDVGYRKLAQSQRPLPPHPPFGIPLDPSAGSPSGGYAYADAADEPSAPDWRNSKKKVEADPLRDDLAYRNLRRESLLRPGARRSVSALSDLEDWTRPRGPPTGRAATTSPTATTTGESMASILAALEGLGQKSPPPVPKRRSVPSSGQKRLHGLTFRA